MQLGFAKDVITIFIFLAVVPNSMVRGVTDQNLEYCEKCIVIRGVRQIKFDRRRRDRRHAEFILGGGVNRRG